MMREGRPRRGQISTSLHGQAVWYLVYKVRHYLICKDNSAVGNVGTTSSMPLSF